MAVALGILMVVLIPITHSFVSEQRAFRACYNRAVAIEIVDGEMEMLRAGQWRSFPEGTQAYAVTAGAATNLPPGRFVLTRAGKHLRLEWLPEKKNQGGKVSRECELR